ncbi:MAG TPA: LuxR C-terminal-related transcriptional regulator [Agriterribacter sp.]|nr:LuxR C-terminal-related transcriptional regulator [Agriterribacter sp.]
MKLLDKGLEELSAGNWKEAKEILEDAVSKDPTAETYEALAQACWWVNDTASVLAHREKAYQLFLEKNNKYGASRNASFLGIDYLELKGEFAIANGWFTRAETMLDGLAPSPEEGLIKLLKGRQAFMLEPTNDTALRLINESMAINKSVGSIDGYMMAEAMKGFILTTEGKMKEGMALLDEATLMATTEQAKNINFVALTCCMLIEACERVRDFERAGQWCNKVKEICTRWQFDAMFSSCRNLYASVLVWKGQWQDAENELTAASAELKKTRPMYVAASAMRLADLRRKQGRWNETQYLLENAGNHALKLLSCAALAFDKDDLTTAANFAERFLRQVPEKEKTRKIAGLELSIRIYAAQEKIEEATPVLDELKAIAAMVNTVPLQAAVKSAEGILRKAAGKYEAAKQLFEDAIDMFDTVNAPFEAARIRLELAEVLITLGRFQLAEPELNHASKTFQTLGAEKYFEKTRLLLRHMHTTNAELQAMNTKLEFTGRELEVLRLIAEGKNNEEMAEQLFLSIRTVEKHITNLYLKMGVSGKSARAFAASYAIKHHLVFT